MVSSRVSEAARWLTDVGSYLSVGRLAIFGQSLARSGQTCDAFGTRHKSVLW
jgi:hypothetical protein